MNTPAAQAQRVPSKSNTQVSYHNSTRSEPLAGSEASTGTADPDDGLCLRCVCGGHTIWHFGQRFGGRGERIEAPSRLVRHMHKGHRHPHRHHYTPPEHCQHLFVKP